MKEWLFKFLKRIAEKALLIFLPLYLIFSTHSMVTEKSTLSPESTRIARDTVKDVWSQLSSSSQYVNFELNQKQLNEVAALVNFTLKNASSLINISPVGVTAAISYKIDLPLKSLYINAYCILAPDYDGFEFSNCKIGSIPVFGWLAEFLTKSMIHLLFGSDAKTTYEKMLSSIVIKDNKLFVQAEKPTDLKATIKSSLKDTTSLVRAIYSKGALNEEKIAIYINHLLSNNRSSNSLSYYLGDVFTLAKTRSADHDPVEENRAAIWALAAVFGNPRFAELAGLDRKKAGSSFQPLTLRGRGDLNLHFLYSVILEQLGDADVGLSVGEVKELLDSNRGGSGYSFADLAADKAGLKFSEFVVADDESARHAQNTLAPLAKSGDESVFFPFIHDLPEGFRDQAFKRIIGDLNSDVYKQLESKIDARIANLPIYNVDSVVENKPSITPNKQREITNAKKEGRWLKVDTHIHTRFSDGNKTVDEIAEQALTFGCDAIAITDHGDYNLQKVTSEQYFSDIDRVNQKYPSLTVIPGLEWNLPPFMGREHATVLLPASEFLPRNLNAFKEKFDSWGRREVNLLSAKNALEWLNDFGEYDNHKPVVIYNHPSRKDAHTAENFHDMVSWRAVSEHIIGMSGAPGHQKKRGVDNGSYDSHLKTIDGWDPTVAVIGGEWDRLLQQGYDVWAARAPSDFHNTGMDYWPCQFSTTHIYAESNRHNDILSAFHRGRFWAQHGRIIDDISFTISSYWHTAHMGETISTFAGDALQLELMIMPAMRDWQGEPVELTDIELVIIEQDEISAVSYVPAKYNEMGFIIIKDSFIPKTKQVVFRVRGRVSRQEQHDYMFYTNPIRVSIKD